MLTLKKLFFKKLYEEEILNIVFAAESNFIKIDRAILNQTLTLRWLIYNRSFVTKTLIKNLKNKNFETPLAIERTVNVEGKERRMYFFDWHIRVLHGVLARILTNELEKILPKELTSYRKGFNIYDTVKETGEYIQEYSLKRPNIKISKSVIRKDVKSYGDSINLAILCKLAKKYLNFDDDFYDLICSNLNFKYISEEDGKTYIKKIGLPTRSPLNTVFTNLYLIELDRSIIDTGIFYRRYGDDLILVGDQVNIANQQIELYKQKLKLVFNEKKEGWVDINKGFFKKFSREMVRYLGFMIAPDGKIYPTIEKDFKIKEYISAAIQISYLSMRKDIKDKELQVQILINSVKISLYKTELYSYLSQIIGTVSIDYLKALDTWIAKLILKFVYQKSSNKVFMKYSFKKLRKNGLPSLQHLQTLRLFRREALKSYIKIKI